MYLNDIRHLTQRRQYCCLLLLTSLTTLLAAAVRAALLGLLVGPVGQGVSGQAAQRGAQRLSRPSRVASYIQRDLQYLQCYLQTKELD